MSDQPTTVAEDKFRAHVLMNTGEVHELPEPFTSRGAQALCADIVLKGWFHMNVWYPPHRLHRIRFEVW